jgi:hypothetical protein
MSHLEWYPGYLSPATSQSCQKVDRSSSRQHGELLVEHDPVPDVRVDAELPYPLIAPVVESGRRGEDVGDVEQAYGRNAQVGSKRQQLPPVDSSHGGIVDDACEVQWRLLYKSDARSLGNAIAEKLEKYFGLEGE